MSFPSSDGLCVSDSRSRLFAKLEELGICCEVVPYPSHASIEEGKALRGAMRGTFTKNLLLKDKKGNYFLVSAHEDRSINLKTLHKRVGGKGQLGFASEDRVAEHLGVRPGALTPLGLINDSAHVVRPVIDSALLDCAQLNFHPLVNDESISLSPNQLLAFIRASGHQAIFVDFDTSEDS
ncbi:prolyl-tRNA synthetase associated domain-containing protein [Achromobacter seleniivolatilans]|uniref:Prolyl-tRNA synthetase associated domain-containing protein n=1 Tax=Achromobacter seleniivolatilans TaxID=3047478 RepID=A0ABY9LZ35_9BURK|nr:prolyl-tRNA synthetase associated domain-containing protein [Achromobacter sp. R39]WMD19710.1 prolyl-tRNA synthetase associated domain-containing protein [Achromobacter sp. R39]